MVGTASFATALGIGVCSKSCVLFSLFINASPVCKKEIWIHYNTEIGKVYTCIGQKKA